MTKNNLYLRNLISDDAFLMLEWMHDQNVIGKLAVDFKHKKIDDCYRFIEDSNKNDTQEIHRAICCGDDEYLGTISLKNISWKNLNAEYAIVLRTKAIGSGVAKFATIEILKIAFQDLHLHKVYLCVKSSNIRAMKFYNKIGFRIEGTFGEHIKSDNGYEDLIWLSMLDSEFKNKIL